MKISEFLLHHGIRENPFAQEDAQTDEVFRLHCLEGAHHPAWDKVYGSPQNPATAVVFGEKGSGKTALRLQMVDHLRQHNLAHPDRRVFVIEYDDFNPFLDCFRERLHGRRRKVERALQSWRLWDHMDAILTLGVTKLVSTVLGEIPEAEAKSFGVNATELGKLNRLQKRDLLVAAAYYDHSLNQSPAQRFEQLRKKLRFGAWLADADWLAGLTLTVLLVVLWFFYGTLSEIKTWWPLQWWFWALVFLFWGPWLWRQGRLLWTSFWVSRQVRVIDHQVGELRKVLARFQRSDLVGQPVPSRDRSDDRYEILQKLQAILAQLGFHGIIVLVDRVDEPHLINGSAERMRDLLWPMFDNKFLKHPGIGFKLLLPREVSHYLNREDKEFYERSRLDKQNLIPSLEWTGESLYDVANARLQACATGPDRKPALREWFDESLGEPELIGTLGRLRVPRHLFKFLYRLLINHCNKYTDDNPRWKIDRETVSSTLAIYQRDLEAMERGMGTG